MSGLKSDEERAPTKLGFAPIAKKHNLAIVFNDVSPRGIDDTCPEAIQDDWTWGYGAGHYCDATQMPWKRHFNMYTYITKELPELIESYFPCDPARKSITGFSMGGNGSMVCAIKNPGKYKSCTAITPIVPTLSPLFGSKAMPAYFGNMKAARAYCAVSLLNDGGKNVKLPPGFITYAGLDQWGAENMLEDVMEEAVRKNGHDFPIKMMEGYNHSYFMGSACIEEHLIFHAAHLNGGRIVTANL